LSFVIGKDDSENFAKNAQFSGIALPRRQDGKNARTSRSFKVLQRICLLNLKGLISESMVALGDILLGLGLIVCLYGEARFLAVARNRSDFWFFGCLFLPFVDYLFLLLNFRIAVKPFVLTLLGLMLVVLSG